MNFINHPITLQHVYDPQIVSALNLEDLKSYVFLLIIEDSSTQLDPILNAFIKSFSHRDQTSLIIYFKNENTPQELIEHIIEEQHVNPDEILDLVIFDQDTLSLNEAPSLIASCHTMIDVLHSKNDFLSKALLMDKQVLRLQAHIEHDEFSQFVIEINNKDIDSLIDHLKQLNSNCLYKENIRKQYVTKYQENLTQQIMNTRVVNIFLWGRSGTLFMQSLLDSHPQVLTLPPHPNFVDFHQTQWPIITQDTQIMDVVIERFIAFNPVIFDGSKDNTNIDLGHLGDDRETPISADASLFRKHIKAIYIALINNGQVVDRKTFFLVLHYAYALTIGQDISNKSLIVHQFHSSCNYEGMVPLKEDFPDVEGIGMMRNPIKGFNSHLRVRVTDKQTGHLIEQDSKYSWDDMVYDGVYNKLYRQILIGWTWMEKRFDIKVHVVKLENLHKEPQKTMKNLAEQLAISWNDSLLESTYNGLKYWGDKSMIKQRSGFSADHPGKSSGKINLDLLDQYVLTGLTKEQLEKHNYLTISPLQKRIVPFLMLWPTRIERRAIVKAIKEKQTENFQNALINIAERHVINIKHFFGREV